MFISHNGLVSKLGSEDAEIERKQYLSYIHVIEPRHPSVSRLTILEVSADQMFGTQHHQHPTREDWLK